MPPDVNLSVLPQPVQTENGEHFAIAWGQDSGIIDRINAALARQRRRTVQR